MNHFYTMFKYYRKTLKWTVLNSIKTAWKVSHYD